jgi:acid phosphatase family membrane protein YuiD
MILEDLIQQVQSAGVPVSDIVPTTLRHGKRRGHTPKEVAAGALFGGVKAVLVFWVSSNLTSILNLNEKESRYEPV